MDNSVANWPVHVESSSRDFPGYDGATWQLLGPSDMLSVTKTKEITMDYDALLPYESYVILFFSKNSKC